ncbi:MAG: ABC transporter permease, partial [Thiothrix sp.]|nr:ABC transporter permease [Thiothrix sp.]
MAAESADLRRQLRRVERRRSLRAFLLVAPLVLFLLVVFVWPIGGLLWRSVDNSELQQVMPATAAGLLAWDGEGLPPEAVQASLVQELRAAVSNGVVGVVGRRLNYEDSGMRSLLNQTLRKLPTQEPASWQAALQAVSPRWADPATWQLLRRAAPATTDRYWLATLDRERNVTGDIVPLPDQERVYLSIFSRTLQIAGIVTLLCLLLGYPLAYLLATLPTGTGNLLLILVLLPFWTSL